MLCPLLRSLLYFNSSKVRLEREVKELTEWHNIDFNSSKVRLELDGIITIAKE